MATKYFIQLGADVTQFQKGIERAQKDLQKFGKKMQGIGKSMSTYVTAPLAGIATLSVAAWDKQAQAIAQVEAGLKSTGNTVGFTSKELQKMASELQKNSLFGDEEILQKVTAQMLTFTNVTGDAFSGAQQAVLDLSARLGTDLQSSALMVGKALNDPVQGITAMSRAGVQFSEDQKQLIKSLVETGDRAEAQRIILAELQKQYGGSAKAAAEVGAGPMIQLKNSISDLTEEFGKIITEALRPFIDSLKEMVVSFQNVDESTKKMILVFGGLAAAIGPVTWAIGAFATVIAAINFKILAIVAAIAVFVAAGWYLYDNWQRITNGIQIFFTNMVNNLILGISSMVKAIQDSFGGALLEELGVNFDGIREKLRGMLLTFPEVSGEIKTFAESMKSVGDVLLPVNQNIETLNQNLAGDGENTSLKNSLQTLSTETIPEFKTASSGLATSIDSVYSATNEASKTTESFKDNSAAATQAFNKSFNAYDHGSKSMAKNAANTARQVIQAQVAKGIAAEVSQAMERVPFPFGIVAAAAAGAAANGLFNSIVPKFADGGIVSGPTLGIMGEYSGARSNPEVIAPLDKLKSMIGQSVIVLDTVIRGEDIYLTQKRYEKQRGEIVA